MAMNTIEKLEWSIHELVEKYVSLRDAATKTAEDTAGTRNELAEARETIITLQKTLKELEKETDNHRERETRKVHIKEQIQVILDKLNNIDSISKVTNA
jgi:hypothetical protein